MASTLALLTHIPAIGAHQWVYVGGYNGEAKYYLDKSSPTSAKLATGENLVSALIRGEADGKSDVYSVVVNCTQETIFFDRSPIQKADLKELSKDNGFFDYDWKLTHMLCEHTWPENPNWNPRQFDYVGYISSLALPKTPNYRVKVYVNRKQVVHDVQRSLHVFWLKTTGYLPTAAPVLLMTDCKNNLVGNILAMAASDMTFDEVNQISRMNSEQLLQLEQTELNTGNLGSVRTDTVFGLASQAICE